MGRRHWLDPLARRLLVAAGQIQRQPSGPVPLERQSGAAAGPGEAGAESRDELVERELLALKLARQPSLRLRTAANMLAVSRVATAHKLRGVYA